MATAGRGRAGAWVTAWARAERASDLAVALCLFVGLRIAFSALAFLVAARGDAAPPCFRGLAAPVLHPTGLDFRLLGVWERWDACWYERIAAVGYPPRDPSVAFFPLYPLLMRVVGVPLGGHLTLAGLVVSALAYIAAIVGLCRLVRRDFDVGVARRAALALSVFPSAFFLFAPYTEALFLALAVWVLDAARGGRWGLAALLALLVGLTRTQGCFLALPLAWEWWRSWRTGRAGVSAALVPPLPVAGLLLFLAYSKAATGGTTFQAQRANWGFLPRPPWAAIAASWHFIRAHDRPIEVLNLTLLLLFTAFLLAGLRRLPPSYSLYATPQLLLIGTREHLADTPLMSTSRFLLVLFPIFVLVALVGRCRPLWYGWLGLSLALLTLLVVWFFRGEFVA